MNTKYTTTKNTTENIKGFRPFCTTGLSRCVYMWHQNQWKVITEQPIYTGENITGGFPTFPSPIIFWQSLTLGLQVEFTTDFLEALSENTKRYNLKLRTDIISVILALNREYILKAETVVIMNINFSLTDLCLPPLPFTQKATDRRQFTTVNDWRS